MWRGPAAIAVFGLSLALVAGAPAKERRAALTGTVVGIDARAGTVVVRHQAFAGMPAMTMPFAVPRSVLPALHPNDRISATVDLTRCPWGLRDIRVLGSAESVPFIPVLDAGATVPDLPLLDQDGRRFSLRLPAGRATILSFIYTRCPDPTMCPLVSAKFSRLQRLIDPRSMHLVTITLDPGFDTPAVLRRYGAAFGEDTRRWTLATGSPRASDELSRRLGIVSTPGDRGLILHSEALVVLDGQGRISQRVDGNAWTPEQALALAREALREDVNPFVVLWLWLTSGIAAICGGGTSGVTVASGIAVFLVLTGAAGLLLYKAFRKAFE